MCYFSQNRHKFYLKCHMIFVCKYRKLLINVNVREFILSTFKQIEEKSDFENEIMETDKDHIHLLINYPPTVSVSSIARRLKQISNPNGTYTLIWEKCNISSMHKNGKISIKKEDIEEYVNTIENLSITNN